MPKPKLADGDARTERVIVSFRPEEKLAVVEAAAEAREYPAAWCRQVVVAAVAARRAAARVARAAIHRAEPGGAAAVVRLQAAEAAEGAAEAIRDGAGLERASRLLDTASRQLRAAVECEREDAYLGGVEHRWEVDPDAD